MNQLAGVLSSARSWGAVDIFSDSLLVSWAKRNKLDEARGLAGQAQAEVTVFQRELADVGVALDTRRQMESQMMARSDEGFLK